MTLKKACICLLAAGIFLAVGVCHATGQQNPSSGACITVFFTGNELGEMKPCGCSGGQLGGFDRRYTVLNSVKPRDRLVFDTGSLIPELSEQNLIKYNIIVQAFDLLGYDGINLTEQDIFIARQAGLFDGLGMLFNCISAADTDSDSLPVLFTKSFTLNGSTADVTVATADTDEQILQLADLLSAPDPCATMPLNILITGHPDAADFVASAGIDTFDCLIVAPISDEPELISAHDERPMVIAAGRLGKYVGRIDVFLSTRQEKPEMTFFAVPITEDLPQYEPLVRLYKDYQRLVKDANLLEKYPKFVLPNYLEYVASRSCKLCHDYEYQMCSTMPHANAFATLEKVGSDYDPECVICHVVGMQYKTGFITPEKTPELRDVDCEVCHGPGSEHIRSLGAIETSGPMSTCSDCHTPEHSTEYPGHEEQYFEKIVHWREPLAYRKVTEIE